MNYKNYFAVPVIGICYLIRGMCEDVVEHRIVGGVEVSDAGMFPFVVLIIMEKGPISTRCTGSILTVNWILSAAHCVMNPRYTIKIYAGMVDVSDLEKSSTQVRIVSEVRRWPYTAFFPYHDVALFKTSKPFCFNCNVHPIAIAKSPFPPRGELCREVGWGVTEFENSTVTLRWVDVMATDNDGCKDKVQNILLRWIICIGDKLYVKGKPGKGACYGDSGGPLICQEVQAGIASNVVFLGPRRCEDPSTFNQHVFTGNVQGWIEHWVPDLLPPVSLQ